MRRVLIAALLFGVASGAVADEGLWTFENFPSDAVRAAHGFAPDQAWLDRVRAATLSLDGCSASIVGASGLVMTNHHCVESCIGALARDDQDINFEPVLAATQAEERICPGLEALNVVEITDVTERVQKVREGKPAAQAQEAASREIEAIVAACEAAAPDRLCEVASLYGGGRPTLYTYRKWTDVRMVLGPETAAGSFGGDPDNFNFPRYAYDVAFLRLYENGSPAVTPQRLRLRPTPLAEGELLFVSGFPGETGREVSVAEVEYYLDSYFPWALAVDSELRGRLLQALEQPGGAPRGFEGLLYGTENNFKRNWTELLALNNPGFMEALREREAKLRADIAARPEIAARVGPAFEEIEQALKTSRAVFYGRNYIEGSPGGGSLLGSYARTIVRAAAEGQRPDGERLPGYSQDSMARLRQDLADTPPLHPERERLLIGFWLSKMREYLGTDHPVVKLALGRESPEELARRIVAQSKLSDPAERLRLFDGGPAAIAASDDPMIRLIAAIEPEARAVALRYTREAQAPIRAALRRINEARFELYGSSIYPDATGTLRLNPGTVEGWVEPDGRVIAPFTRFGGLGDRATGAPPYRLAPRWQAALGKLDPETIFNVATNNDTIGGNSGSPVVDRDGNVVAAMFDGNIYSNGGYYLFDPKLNRSVLVASTAILEGLAKVYGLDHVVSELTGD
jgi:hypothetical protein